MERNPTPFLTARWLHLAILNYEIDPAVLARYVPHGTELDRWQDATLASVVGFLFRDARVWNVGVPFHRHFEEVNLRFYVRRKTPDGWRRGVVFIKELAPRRAVAWAARLLYGENYRTVPMGHSIDIQGDGHARRVAYWWRFARQDYRIEIAASGTGAPAAAGSEAEFITDQSWGYSGGAGRRTIEYRVEHSPWTIWESRDARLTGDVEQLYGEPFARALCAPPRSAYLADGSPIALFKGTVLS